jgi:hypothetical protein
MKEKTKKKKPISVQARKAKGRRLQQYVRDAIISCFNVNKKDVMSTSMGAGGTDVKMSKEVNDMFPYDIECKNKETLNVWKEYEHAISHKKNTKSQYEPLLVIKKNGKKPLAVINFDHFMEIINKNKNADK